MLRWRIAAFTLAIAAVARPAFPAGFGFFGTVGFGKTDFLEARRNTDIYSVDYSKKNIPYGGGITIGSGKPDDGYHNRIGIAFEGISSTGGRYTFKPVFRASLSNTFAFRVAGTDSFRFWLGPLLGVHYLTGKYETHRSREWSPEKKRWLLAANLAFPGMEGVSLWYCYLDPMWKRTHGGGMQAGVALGFDILAGESAAITIEAGFRCGLIYLNKPGFNYEGHLAAGCLFGSV